MHPEITTGPYNGAPRKQGKEGSRANMGGSKITGQGARRQEIVNACQGPLYLRENSTQFGARLRKPGFSWN